MRPALPLHPLRAGMDGPDTVAPPWDVGTWGEYANGLQKIALALFLQCQCLVFGKGASRSPKAPQAARLAGQ